jgi:hypothetical protein
VAGPSDAELDALIERATVDAYDEHEGARAVRAALFVPAGQAVPAGQLAGGWPGIAGRRALLAVTGL